MVVRYAPLGVVGVIGPWNYPLNNSFGDCIPALAAGNAVVLKPSEITPLTSLLMAEMLAECGMPDGVFQVATGRGETGAALVDEVDFVMFTGSVATGKKVMAQAAADADPGQPRARRQGPDDRARRRRPRARRQRRGRLRRSTTRARSASRSSGSTSRTPVHDEFVEQLTEKVAALRQGPPGRAGLGRRRRDHLPAAARADRGARRRRGRQGRHGGHRRRARPRAPAASSSRPCSPTSTTRCAA